MHVNQAFHVAPQCACVIYIGGFISQYGFIELLFMLLEMDMLLQSQRGDLFLANKGGGVWTNCMFC